MIHASNFEFDGRCANDMGYYIVNFDGISNGEQDYADTMVYNTSKAANSPHIHIHGFHTEEPKKFNFQIMKFRCDGRTTGPILPREQAFIKRWLEKKDGYRYLRFPEAGYEDIFYYCTLSIKWYKIGSEIYGATVYVTCDSTNAYSDIQSYEIQNFKYGDSFQIYNDSDDIGQIEMTQIEIVAKSNGNIHITNNMDTLYSYNSAGMSIKNCKTNEILIINGLTKEISSKQANSEHTYLMDDYNYNPLHLINLDDTILHSHSADISQLTDSRINIIKNEGITCDLSFAYRTIRTGVI